LDGLTIARERIAREAEENTGFLDLGALGLKELPEELFALKHLRGLNLGMRYVDEEGKKRWSTPDLGRNSVAALLRRLAGLGELQFLALSGLDLSDLAPLRGLANLQYLDCSYAKLSTLATLRDLSQLQFLDCSYTLASDLAPLQDLTNLQRLHCSWMPNVSDLAPLAGLSDLQYLDCYATPVSDFAPLRDLCNLLWLDCSFTYMSDLAPLEGLSDLQYLDCSSTQVSNLAPLQSLCHLQSLACSECRLTSVPEGFWLNPSLKNLYLWKTEVPGIPAEVLSQEVGENCLDSLHAHLRDLEKGREEVSGIKLMMLGNGLIGKTQICRRLRGEDYDESEDSTHGIRVTSAPLPGSKDVRLQIWDFGGQDIYHGTHALFLRSRAIFPLVWIPQAERAPEHRHGAFIFRNRPLAYWLDYVKHFGGTDSPVLVIQNRCDKPEDEILSPPVPQEALAAFPFKKVLHYSAKKNRGRAALDEALHEAAVWLCEKQGVAEIGTGRARINERLEKMRDEDAARPPAERRWRTIPHDHFLEMCEEAGGISSPGHLLSYLHNAGVVFYREGLFGDQLILDQGWALEAIYAVFHREKCVKRLRRQNGRFTRSDLADWLWDAAGHTIAEQELFLGMMRSCGICFAHKPAVPEKDIEAEYVAPDFLPEKSEIAQDLALKWEAGLAGESAEFEYPFLHPGLMRAIVSRVGSDAGVKADYWKGGLFFYEEETRSRALIEEELIEGWRVRIKVSTQRGQAAVLLQRLVALIEEEHRRTGVSPSIRKVTRAPLRFLVKPGYAEAIVERAPGPPPPLKFGQEPAAKPEYFVSYAWKDETSEGKERELIVDRLCVAAEERGVTILRDKKVVGLGDRISKFMQLIGRGNRVFVVLSDKYLKSPYCVYELYELWRNCRQNDDEFLSHVRVYTLPDAKIWTPLDRAKRAAYWRDESGRLEAVFKDYGYDILGKTDVQKYLLMKQFSHQIGEILATVADILQPRNFEEFLKYGFDDPPNATPP
jgi:internalin A